MERSLNKEFKAAKKGIQRFHWNLRYTAQTPINLNTPSFYNPFAGNDEGTLVAPGTLYCRNECLKQWPIAIINIDPVSFEVKALNNVEMPAEDRNEKVAFQKAVAQLQADFEITQNSNV